MLAILNATQLIAEHSGTWIRTLKLSRFVAIEPTNETFQQEEGFSLSKHFGNAWRIIPGRGEGPQKIRIWFSPVVADSVAETIWHKTQAVNFQEDGSIEVEYEVDGFDEILWWILGYRPNAKVIDPPGLAARVCDAAKATMAMYAAINPDSQ